MEKNSLIRIIDFNNHQYKIYDVTVTLCIQGFIGLTSFAVYS